MSMDVPFERSYWVEPGKLLAGCYPGAKQLNESRKKLTGLLDAGIRHIVNLMEEQETDRQGDGFEPYEEAIQRLAEDRNLIITCQRMPIRDLSVPSLRFMKHTLDAIDHAIAQDKPTYVHCWGGRGRTGTVVGCWLARHGKATGNQALDLIKELRKNDPTSLFRSPETEQQRQMVKRWKQGQ
jgi:protein tyrosine/serine phosphatase